MFLTVESYKSNMYTLNVLTNIYNSLKDLLEKNPYSDLEFGDWKISNKPIFKDGIESNLVLRNETNDENINITFSSLDELMEDDDKFDIVSVVLYIDNGTNDEKIEKSNYIYNICNLILELLENKYKNK